MQSGSKQKSDLPVAEGQTAAELAPQMQSGRLGLVRDKSDVQEGRHSAEKDLPRAAYVCQGRDGMQSVCISRQGFQGPGWAQATT
jgi:hypothetical protein